MLQKIFKVNLFRTILILFSIMTISCASGDKKTTGLEDSIEIVEVDEKLITEIKTAKQIFYSLPSDY